jgi:hypothetical protein
MSYTITVTSRELSAEQRRALEILAAAGLRGCAGATLVAHGLDNGMIARLVHTKLATARRETVKAGRKTIQGVRIVISDGGRRALEGDAP